MPTPCVVRVAERGTGDPPSSSDDSPDSIGSSGPTPTSAVVTTVGRCGLAASASPLQGGGGGCMSSIPDEEDESDILRQDLRLMSAVWAINGCRSPGSRVFLQQYLARP